MPGVQKKASVTYGMIDGVLFLRGRANPSRRLVQRKLVQRQVIHLPVDPQHVPGLDVHELTRQTQQGHVQVEPQQKILRLVHDNVRLRLHLQVRTQLGQGKKHQEEHSNETHAAAADRALGEVPGDFAVDVQLLEAAEQHVSAGR